MKRYQRLSWVVLVGLLCACHGSGSAGSDFDPNVTRTYNLKPLASFPGVADWTNSGGGPSHSGYVPVTLDAAGFSLRWSAVVPKGNTDRCDNADGFFNCLSIYQAETDSTDGRVVVMTEAGFGSANSDSVDFVITGLDETDGSVAWSQAIELGGDPINEPIFDFTAPSASGGKIYFSYGVEDLGLAASSEVPVLDAFDAKTGASVFSVKPPAVGVTESVVSDLTLYTGFPLSAFDAGTGALRWTSADGGDPSPAPGAVYLAGSGGLIALAPASGAQLSPVLGSNQGGSATAPILDSRGGAVVGVLGTASRGSLGVVQPAAGSLDHFSLSTHARDWAVSGAFSHITTPVAAKGVVYACNGLAMDAYDDSDGHLLWSWTPTGDASLQDDATGNSDCSLVVTDNLLFVGSGQATYAVDLSSHATVWSWPEGGKLSISPSGILYISVHAPVSPSPAQPDYLGHLVAINLH